MQNDPQLWITALRNSHDRLTSLVQPLGSDRVDQASMADDWSIAQVLAHLGSQAEIFGAFLDAGLEEGAPPGQDSFPPIWDAWNAKSAPDQVADSLAADEAFVRKIEGLSKTQLAGIKLAMFGMEIDATRLLQMRLSEHALHTWDVAASLEPEAAVPEDAVALLIDTLPEMVARVGKADGGALRIHIMSSDPSRDLVLAVDDDGVKLGKWEDGSADGELRIPSEALLRLVSGRLDDEHTPRIEIDGDGLDLDRLRKVFPGF